MLPHDIFIRHRHIGLDLDETLAETFPGLLEYAHKKGKLLTIPTIEQLTSYDFVSADLSITPSEASEIWEGFGKDTLDPATIPIVAHAKEGVEKLLGLGHTLSIITARSDRESWKVERTLAWIQTHFPEIGSAHIAFVNHFSDESKPKSGACKECGVTLLIDDSIENAYDLSREGIATIILEKPWNRDIIFNHPLVYRVKSWENIIENIKRCAW